MSLRKAVRDGNVDLVNRLLDEGANINAQDRLYETPLYIAASKGDEMLVTLLLDRGAKIDGRSGEFYPGEKPLNIAAEKGHFKIVELLLDRGANINEPSGTYSATPLLLAAGNGHIDIVRLLLDRGARVDTPYPNTKSLWMAARNGYLDIVKLLIERGADIEHTENEIGLVKVNPFGYTTPLSIAAAYGHLEIVKFLFDLGSTGIPDKAYMKPAIYYAVIQDHLPVVDFLLTNTDIDPNRYGLLNAAVASGNIRIVEYLLNDSRIDVNNQTDITSDTPLQPPLYIASRELKLWGQEWERTDPERKEIYMNIIRLLIDHGANPLDEVTLFQDRTAFNEALPEFRRLMYPSSLLSTSRLVRNLPLGVPRLSSNQIRDVLATRAWERRRHAVTGWAEALKRNQGTYGGTDVYSDAAAAMAATATGAAVEGGGSGGGNSNGAAVEGGGSQGGGARKRKTRQFGGKIRKLRKSRKARR